MFNSEEFKKVISESGKSITFIASEVGITREGFYKKMNGETEFKASEISKLCKVLGLKGMEIMNIFFNS